MGLGGVGVEMLSISIDGFVNVTVVVKTLLEKTQSVSFLSKLHTCVPYYMILYLIYIGFVRGLK